MILGGDYKMNIQLIGIDEVLFFVDNMAEAKEWIKVLLEKEPDFQSENYYSFNLGFCKIGLHPSDSKSSSGVAGQVSYWKVSDMQSAISHFIDHGCRLFRGPIIGVDGVKICQLIDPFGNAWGLIESV